MDIRSHSNFNTVEKALNQSPGVYVMYLFNIGLDYRSKIKTRLRGAVGRTIKTGIIHVIEILKINFNRSLLAFLNQT